MPNLTKRERALAVLLVNGSTQKEAARSLLVCERNVEKMVQVLKRKTGSTTRIELGARLSGYLYQKNAENRTPPS